MEVPKRLAIIEIYNEPESRGLFTRFGDTRRLSTFNRAILRSFQSVNIAITVAITVTYVAAKGGKAMSTIYVFFDRSIAGLPESSRTCRRCILASRRDASRRQRHKGAACARKGSGRRHGRSYPSKSKETGNCARARATPPTEPGHFQFGSL